MSIIRQAYHLSRRAHVNNKMMYYGLEFGLRFCYTAPGLRAAFMPRSSPFVIELAAAERKALETVARKYTAPYRDVVRAKVILLAAEGWQNDQIAARLDMPTQHVSKWRKRFCQERLAGLVDRPRRPRRGRAARSNQREPAASPVHTLLD